MILKWSRETEEVAQGLALTAGNVIAHLRIGLKRWLA